MVPPSRTLMVRFQTFANQWKKTVPICPSRTNLVTRPCHQARKQGKVLQAITSPVVPRSNRLKRRTTGLTDRLCRIPLWLTPLSSWIHRLPWLKQAVYPFATCVRKLRSEEWQEEEERLRLATQMENLESLVVNSVLNRLLTWTRSLRAHLLACNLQIELKTWQLMCTFLKRAWIQCISAQSNSLLTRMWSKSNLKKPNEPQNGLNP